MDGGRRARIRFEGETVEFGRALHVRAPRFDDARAFGDHGGLEP
jgi:hypothetical protein